MRLAIFASVFAYIESNPALNFVFNEDKVKAITVLVILFIVQDLYSVFFKN